MKSFPGIEELSMTTNALLLGRIAADLAEAGLDRVNISIDTLDPDRFKAMTRGGRLDLVWQGIEAADAAGLRPIKLNAVVVRDQNDHEVGDLAALTLDRAWQVRFLEIMPLEGVGDVHDEGLVTSEETQARLEARFGPLEPVETDPADPARLWRIPGAAGTIGFISPVSAPFCAACNRVRLTADGKLRLCLLRPDEVDLRDVMRAGADDDDARARRSGPHLAQALGPRTGRRRAGDRPRHVADRRLSLHVLQAKAAAGVCPPLSFIRGVAGSLVGVSREALESRLFPTPPLR